MEYGRPTESNISSNMCFNFQFWSTKKISSIWSDVLGQSVNYAGDDPTEFENNMASFMPKWTAYEMRLMAERYVSDGMVPKPGDVERLTNILGRPLKSYRDFAINLTSN